MQNESHPQNWSHILLDVSMKGWDALDSDMMEKLRHEFDAESKEKLVEIHNKRRKYLLKRHKLQEDLFARKQRELAESEKYEIESLETKNRLLTEWHTRATERSREAAKERRELVLELQELSRPVNFLKHTNNHSSAKTTIRTNSEPQQSSAAPTINSNEARALRGLITRSSRTFYHPKIKKKRVVSVGFSDFEKRTIKTEHVYEKVPKTFSWCT